MREGVLALAAGKAGGAEGTWRKALPMLVEAFFEDRRRNGDLFGLAHRVGDDLARLFGCPLTVAKDGSVTNPCPVPMLHNRIATSAGLIVDVECSICGEPPLLCEHVNAAEYDGATCVHRITSIDLDHMAFTADPDFAYGFMIQVTVSPDEVAAALGRRARGGESLFCTHCHDCYGTNGASEEDLSPPTRLPLVEAPERTSGPKV